MHHRSLARLFRRILLLAPLGLASGLAACGQGSVDPAITTCSESQTFCCKWEIDFPGGAPEIAGAADCPSLCEGDGTHPKPFGCSLKPDSTTAIICGTECTGRRPAGLSVAARRPAASALGAYLAEVAQLEAASVGAFHALAADLAAHGAPPALRRAARVAARDEIRHARVTSRLARRHGGAPAAFSVSPPPPRSLEAIAAENAVEGCVRETFGALVAAYQAARAEDPQLRSALSTIARDEARHAALAWRVAAWAEQRLGSEANARIAEARRAAGLRLVEAQGEADRALQREAGLPGSEAARGMAREMARTLWS